MGEWSKLPSIGPVRTGCLCCPPRPEAAPMNYEPHPGFGLLSLYRDGEGVGDREWDWDTTVQDFEEIAAGNPDHDWRFEVYGPLGGVTYQRHGEAEWYAVLRNEGFA